MAQPKSPYVMSQFKLRATVGDVTFPDIVSMSATFALNSIPTATLVVPTGINIATGQPAAIHLHKNKLRARDKVKVILTIETADGDISKMPSGEYVVFEGFYVGMGYQRSYSHANYELRLVHWLDDLNNSSLLNGNWLPNAPFDMAQNAASYILGPAAGDNTGMGGGGNSAWSTVPAIDPDGKIVTAANIGQDMWGAVLKPALAAIANFPAPVYQNETGAKNDAALAALARMPGKGQKYYQPLGLDIASLVPSTIQNAVQSGLSKEALEGFAYSTFWSKLIGDYGSQFFFAISPSVEFATPVPFFAGLRGYYKMIDTDEYSYANFNSSLTQIIESVDIFYPSQTSTTNFALGEPNSGAGDPPPGLVYPLGWYPPLAKQNKRGMKLLKEPPGWMYNFIPESAYAGMSTGTTGRELGDTTCPQEGETETPTDVPTPVEAQLEVADSAALSRFAEHYFKTEVLSQRFGELSGKLRFDIAPGTIIAIGTPSDDPRTTTPADTFIATVMQVSYVINAEKATAGTSFVLAHLRTFGENADDLYTRCETCGGVDRPPLYKKPWYGAPLALRS